MPHDISNRKLKQIRRMAADSRSLEEIARAVDLPISRVEEILRPAGRAAAPGQAVPLRHRLQELVGWLAIGGLFIAPLLHSKRLYNLCNLPQQAFVQVWVVLLAGVWLVQAWLTRDRRLLLHPGLPAVAAFLLWAGASGFWAHNSYEFWSVYGHWLACGGLWFVLTQIMRVNRWQDRLLYLVFAIGLTQAVIGIAQFLLIPPVLTRDAFLFGLRQALMDLVDTIPQVAAPAGTFANKNFSVHVIVPAMALAIGFFWRDPRRWAAWLYALSAALMAAYLWYTGGRAGWLSLSVQLILWAGLLAWQLHRLRAAWTRQRGAVLAAALGLLLVLVHLTPAGFAWTLKPQLDRIRLELNKVPAFFSEPPPALVAPEDLTPGTSSAAVVEPAAWSFANLPPIEVPPRPVISTEASFTGRLKVWRNTLFLIRDHPFLGVGLGNFSIHFPLYDGRSDGQPMFDDRIQLESSHNDYVQVWSELGTVGLLLGAVLAGAFLLLLRRLLKPDSEVWWEAAAVLVAVAGMAVNAFWSSPLEKAIPLVILAALGAWTSLAWGRTRTPRSILMPAWLPPALAAAAAVGLIVLASFQVRRLRTDHHYVYMTAASKASRWDICLDHSRRGAELLPSRRKIFAFLGKCYLETAESQRSRELVVDSFTRAIDEFAKTLEAYPNTPNTLFDVGVCYAKRNLEGDKEKAMEYYELVRRLVPTYPRLYNNIAAIRLGQDRAPEAIEAFRIEAALNPDNEKVLLNLGLALLQTGDPVNAETALRRAIKAAPLHADAWRNLGLACTHNNHLAEAEIAFRRATELDPNLVVAWQNLGHLLLQRLNRPEEGRKYLQKAAELQNRPAVAPKQP